MEPGGLGLSGRLQWGKGAWNRGSQVWGELEVGGSRGGIQGWRVREYRVGGARGRGKEARNLVGGVRYGEKCGLGGPPGSLSLGV